MIQCKTVNTPYTVSVGRGRIDFPWLCGLIKCHQLGVFTHVLEYGVYYRVASSTPDIKGGKLGLPTMDWNNPHQSSILGESYPPPTATGKRIFSAFLVTI